MPKLCLYFPTDFEDEAWAKSSFCLSAPDGDHAHGRAGEWILGRHPAADITLNIRSVSTRHCAISYSYASDTWSIQDLSSTNGTWVNDQRLPSKTMCPLKIGDHIFLGSNSIAIAEDEHDTENLGPSTVSATKPIDHRTGAVIADEDDNREEEEEKERITPPRTYADSVYLGLQWLFSARTAAGKIYRIFVVACMVSLVIVLLSVL